MSTDNFSLKNSIIPNASKMRFGIVVTEWNNDITDKLLDGVNSILLAQGVSERDITVFRVPGCFELIFACAEFSRQKEVDAIIALGCVIRGDTPHFDYICQGTTAELARLNSAGQIPVIYGVLTTNTKEQAEARAGGNLGNKGEEFAITAIKMVDFSMKLRK